MTVRYRVSHETSYRYAAPVALSQQVLHLLPRHCDWQQVHGQRLVILPAPSARTDHEDLFGNPETRIALEAPHDALTVVAELDVTVSARPWAVRSNEGPAWELVRDALRFGGGAPLDPCRYGFESPYVRVKNELADFTRPSFLPGRPLLEAAADLTARIHREFRYDPDATQVGTSVVDVLARRRGVCQDFAHLAIGGLRSLGLAARYVSGYLCTAPPPGQPRLAGADASHAWLALYCPEFGWVEFDPTNNCEADQRYVLVAWGRDFGDVSPLRGVIRGGGGHTLSVRVSVVPEGE